MIAASPRAPLHLPVRARHASRLVERNLMAYRHSWIVLVSGFFEPLLYLLGIGFGVGRLVGSLPGQSGASSYAAFVAPALMASSAMNGAIYETSFNLFFKLKYNKLYDLVLATPLGVMDVAVGEISWALMRGTIYAAGFIVVMSVLGLVFSPWAILAAPAAVLIGLAFAGVGCAVTTYMRSWQDFDVVQIFLLGSFLFSATFYPLSRYGAALQVVVQCTPLYHGVHMLRALTIGDVGPGLLLDAGYLAAMGALGIAFTARRLGRLLLR